MFGNNTLTPAHNRALTKITKSHDSRVSAAHVVRRRTGRADWAAIEKIHDALLGLTGSPVVAINRAGLEPDPAVREFSRRQRADASFG